MGKRTNRNGLAIAIIAIGTISLAGLGIYTSNSKASPKPVDNTPPVASQQKPAVEVEVTPDSERDQVTALTPNFNGDELKFDASKVTPPAGVDPKAWVVNEYLRTLNAVPEDAKVLSCTIDDSTKTATVDFSKEIEAGYGTSDEMALVNGVLTVMSQFPNVDAVKFTVEGKTIETFGNIDLTDPQPALKMPSN